MKEPLVSVLINNYNYGQFLREAIDSALSQSYGRTEVIVVDDGSTDDSREIIASYGAALTSILQQNAGQASAFNTAVAASRGDILCFLDSDDYFYPQKVERVVCAFHQLTECKALMVHHPLTIRRCDHNEDGAKSFGRTHENPLNLAEYARKYGYLYYAAGATSGMSINRRMAELLFPLPERHVRISADEFVVLGASLVGELHSLREELGAYRVHGTNNWFCGSKRKSPEAIDMLDSYLTRKLSENGLPGAISYRESMWCWWDLVRDERWTELGKRVVKTNIVQHDWHTLGFTKSIVWAAVHRLVENGRRLARQNEVTK